MAKKTTKKPVVAVDTDDEDFDPPPTGKKGRDPDDDPMKPRPRYDVYFGLTLMTTLILIGAAALLYFDQENLKTTGSAGFSPLSVTAGPLGLVSAKK